MLLWMRIGNGDLLAVVGDNAPIGKRAAPNVAPHFVE